jgi:DNA-binding response OmpR family regulator
VLVVDDDAETLAMYEASLRAAGFWVARASDALEAFEYALDVLPDAVIAELGLPGPMNGADLIREIHSDAALRDVPVLAVSSRDPKDGPSVNGLTISALLIKPIAPALLLERLNDAIAQSAVARAQSSAALDRFLRA